MLVFCFFQGRLCDAHIIHFKSNILCSLIKVNFVHNSCVIDNNFRQNRRPPPLASLLVVIRMFHQVKSYCITLRWKKRQQRDMAKYETHFEFQWDEGEEKTNQMRYFTSIWLVGFSITQNCFGLYLFEKATTSIYMVRLLMICTGFFCCWNNNPQTMLFRSHEHKMYGSVLLFGWIFISVCVYFSQFSLILSL